MQHNLMFMVSLLLLGSCLEKVKTQATKRSEKPARTIKIDTPTVEVFYLKKVIGYARVEEKIDKTQTIRLWSDSIDINTADDHYCGKRKTIKTYNRFNGDLQTTWQIYNNDKVIKFFQYYRYSEKEITLIIGQDYNLIFSKM